MILYVYVSGKILIATGRSMALTSEKNKSPSNKLVVSVHMPKRVSTLDAVYPSPYHGTQPIRGHHRIDFMLDSGTSIPLNLDVESCFQIRKYHINSSMGVIVMYFGNCVKQIGV